MTNTERQFQILLVEDSPTDADLAMRAFKRGHFNNCVHHVRDGVQALQFVRKEADFTDAPRPDLILLDLNLPRMNGREVLRELKQSERKRIPVIVLTTSADKSDVEAAYRLLANAYIVKPVNVRSFFDVVDAMEQFLFHTARLPQ